MSGPTQDHGEQSKALPTPKVEEAPAISHSVLALAQQVEPVGPATSSQARMWLSKSLKEGDTTAIAVVV